MHEQENVVLSIHLGKNYWLLALLLFVSFAAGFGFKAMLPCENQQQVTAAVIAAKIAMNYDYDLTDTQVTLTETSQDLHFYFSPLPRPATGGDLTVVISKLDMSVTDLAFGQ